MALVMLHKLLPMFVNRKTTVLGTGMAFLLAQTLVHLFHVLLLLFCAGNAYFISFCSVFSSSSTTSSFPARIPSATQVRIWFASSSRLNAFIAAVTAAETGHLVLATLHTRGASQAIERLVDTFPAQEKDPVRNQLAGSLRAVLAQKLVQTFHMVDLNQLYTILFCVWFLLLGAIEFFVLRFVWRRWFSLAS